jgi:hypothetical protein
VRAVRSSSPSELATRPHPDRMKPTIDRAPDDGHLSQATGRSGHRVSTCSCRRLDTARPLVRRAPADSTRGCSSTGQAPVPRPVPPQNGGLEIRAARVGSLHGLGRPFRASNGRLRQQSGDCRRELDPVLDALARERGSVPETTNSRRRLPKSLTRCWQPYWMMTTTRSCGRPLCEGYIARKGRRVIAWSAAWWFCPPARPLSAVGSRSSSVAAMEPRPKSGSTDDGSACA